MKTRVLLLLAFGLTMTVSAKQLAGSRPSAPAPSHAAAREILQQQISMNGAAKTTQIKKRLIGFSYLANNALVDTTRFYYSGTRGFHPFNIYSYTDRYQPQISIILFDGHFITTQAIQCDSLEDWWANNSGGMDLNERKKYVYDADNHVTSCFDSLAASYYQRTDLDYDIAGRVASFISYDTFGGTQFIPKSRTYVSYNSMGLRTQDSSVLLPSNQPAYKSEYTYDNNGNLVMFRNSVLQSGVWEPQGQDMYLYDNNNRLLSGSYQYYYLGDLYDNWKDSFEYTGNNTTPSVLLNYYYNNQIDDWMPAYKEFDNLNAQGQVDTYYIFTPNGSAFDTSEKDYIVYDADGLAQYGHGFHYSGFGTFEPTPYDKQTWYYEEYDDATSAGGMVSSDQISIYPNPTADYVTVRDDAHQVNQISVVDLAGKLLYKGRPGQSASTVVDLRSYAPGSYLLLLTDEKGALLQRQKLLRL